MQPLTTSTHTIRHWNRVAAMQVSQRNIPVIDAYRLTLSRPDHRECTTGNDPRNKMAHAGPQVYDVLVRQWCTLVLEAMAKS